MNTKGKFGSYKLKFSPLGICTGKRSWAWTLLQTDTVGLVIYMWSHWEICREGRASSILIGQNWTCRSLNMLKVYRKQKPQDGQFSPSLPQSWTKPTCVFHPALTQIVVLWAVYTSWLKMEVWLSRRICPWRITRRPEALSGSRHRWLDLRAFT